MTIKSFTFNPFMTNCYIAHDAGEAVLVDPSSHAATGHQAIVRYIEDHELTVRHLLLTHAHIDHIFGCAFFTDRYGLPWRLHRADKGFIDRAQEQAAAFGVKLETPPELGDYLQEGEAITFGDAHWEVLHTPGHSPGSVSFYDAAERALIAGDVLFSGSIGRTDLPGGSLPQLMQTIFQRLVPLGDETSVYPGHGPSTTIKRERTSNPFLRGAGAAL